MPSAGGKDLEGVECVMRDGRLEAKTEAGAIEFAYLRPDAILDIHTGDWTASAFLVLAHELEKRR